MRKDKIKRKNMRQFFWECAWIGKYSLRYKWQVIWYTFLGLLGTAMSLAGSVASKYVIDAVTGNDSHVLIAAAVFYVLMQLCRIGITAITGRISTKVSILVSQQIRADVFDRMMETEWEAVSAYHSGDLLNRLAGDVGTITSGVLGWIPDLVTRFLQFVGTLGVILYYDPTLAIFALLSAPVSVLVGRFATGRMRTHSQTMRKLSSELMVFNEESLQNLQTLKAFDLTARREDELRQLQKKHKKASLDYNLFSLGNTVVLSLVGTVTTVACTGWGVYRLWTGHISYGTMMLFLQLATSLAGAFTGLIRLIPNAISSATAAGRVMEITQLPREDYSRNAEALEFKKYQGDAGIRVTLDQVDFGYAKGNAILQDVTLQADAGQIVALVGPSGGGKTTILRMLLGIVRPLKGVVQVVGRDGSIMPLDASTRCLFSYVPQSNTIFAGTVAENLRMVKPDATEEEMIRVLRIACAEGFVMKKPQGLDAPILEKGGGFSLGQIQRISIARALLSDGPILLLDEATSALDLATERQVLHNIMEADLYRTCIVATHRPSVLSLCQRAYRVEGGQVRQVSQKELTELMRIQ